MALAVVCVGVQLDYAVEDDPELARLVFPPFKGLAYAVAAETALANEMGAPAVRASEALALERPTASESFSRLARAYALEGDSLKAERAIFASAARGWRDPLAQLIILQAGLSVEDWDVVAQRLTALRKMRRNHDFFDQQLVQLASFPRGRQELAAQFAADQMGLRQFMRGGLALLPPDQFADIMVRSAAATEEVNCETFNLATERLLRAGHRESAMQVWIDQCRDGAVATGNKFLFASRTADSDPFAWRYPRASGLSSFVATGSNGQPSLQFANNSRLNRVIAERFLVLDPGTYTLAITESAATSRRPSRRSEVSPVLQCLGEESSDVATESTGADWTLTVPPQGCEVQMLRLLATPGSDTILAVRVD
ncbi:hypothetical protein P8R33_07635 [Qipengyuania sp. XHP0211]|uniref:hypothetical protein n=1 Tax=Qipengyuania sp. XHP0211 TaxID=3038079 RepID=UPI00241D2AE1|nr:hypothetical protein [Qipengyuania sp. XHP0211]MDG5750972.1 hypothetical protein [Qipengyuania sp. XHP0211]